MATLMHTSASNGTLSTAVPSGTVSLGGVQLAATDALNAIRLVADYLDYLELLPAQAQRVVSQIRQLNVRTYGSLLFYRF